MEVKEGWKKAGCTSEPSNQKGKQDADESGEKNRGKGKGNKGKRKTEKEVEEFMREIKSDPTESREGMLTITEMWEQNTLYMIRRPRMKARRS